MLIEFSRTPPPLSWQPYPRTGTPPKKTLPFALNFSFYFGISFDSLAHTYIYVGTYGGIYAICTHTHIWASNFLLRSSWNEIQKSFFFAWWKLQFSSYFSLNFHAKRKKLFALLLLPFVRFSFPDVLSPRNHTSTLTHCVCALVSFLLASFIPHQRPFNLFPLHRNLKLKLKLKPRLGVLAVLSVTRMLCVSNWKGKEQDERRNLKTQLKLK